MISETSEALFQLDTFNPRLATSSGAITIDIRTSYQTMGHARSEKKIRASFVFLIYIFFIFQYNRIFYLCPSVCAGEQYSRRNGNNAFETVSKVSILVIITLRARSYLYAVAKHIKLESKTWIASQFYLFFMAISTLSIYH